MPLGIVAVILDDGVFKPESSFNQVLRLLVNKKSLRFFGTKNVCVEELRKKTFVIVNIKKYEVRIFKKVCLEECCLTPFLQSP
jgi:hypothetical protein